MILSIREHVMKRLILITIIVLLTYIGYSYAGIDDRSDRLSNNQSGIFSPGYINAAKQRTENIINQSSRPKSLMENIAEYVKNKLGSKVDENAADKPIPELKKKTSRINEDPNVGTLTTQATEASSASETKVTISKAAEASDALLNDAKAAGTITKTLSTGNRLNIWMEGDTAYFNIKNSSGAILVNKQAFGSADSSQKSYVSDFVDMGLGNFAVIVTNYNSRVDGDFYKYDATQSLKVYSSQGAVKRQDNYTSYDYRNLASGEYSYDYNTIGKIYCADINMTGSVNSLDYSVMWRVMGRATSTLTPLQQRADINRDGIVDNADYTLLQNAWFTTSVNTVTSNTEKGSYALGTRSISVTTAGSNVNSADVSTAAYRITNPLYTQFNTSNFTENSQSITPISADVDKKLRESFISKKFKNLSDKESANTAATDVSERMLAYKDALTLSGDAIFKAYSNRDNPGDAEMMLSKIIRNPTQDEKKIMDVLTDILITVEGLNKDSAGAESLKQAADDLLQMVASVLIAQAVPDLLKEGDVANIKGIFSDLDTSRRAILTDYNESVKPYYDEMKKMLSSNKSVVFNAMLEKELSKMEPNDIDKVLEKLHKASNKSFEEEYILQQEEKYRKQYIDPNKKVLEDKMKVMMKDFTQRLSGVLEGAQKTEKK